AEDGIRDDLVTGVQTCALPILVVPEALDSFLLSHDHVRAVNILREARENSERLAAARVDEHCMSDQSHAFQIAQVIAASIESASDRKSTRLNSSHQIISYAVFC